MECLALSLVCGTVSPEARGVHRWQVEFGYPFVAQNLEEMADMLDRLRSSAALRQEASRIMLAIGKYLSVRPGRALNPACGLGRTCQGIHCKGRESAATFARPCM